MDHSTQMRGETARAQVRDITDGAERSGDGKEGELGRKVEQKTNQGRRGSFIRMWQEE